MSASIDGLVSGLDTTTVINQLMNLERAPVTQMQTRQASFDAIASAWGDLAGRISTVRTAAEAIDTTTELSLFKVASSDTTLLTATAAAGAAPGPVTLRVAALATADQQATTTLLAGTSSLVGTGTVTISAGKAAIGATGIEASDTFTAGAHTIAVTQPTAGGSFYASLDGGTATEITGSSVTLGGTAGSIRVDFGSTITTGTASVSVAQAGATTTLSDLAGALTAAGGPARAQAVAVDGGARLIVTAAATGTANALDIKLSGALAGALGGVSTLRAAADADIVIPGSGPLGDLHATRSSNTVSDLLPGVTLNLAKAAPDTDVTITVGTDADAVVAKVKTLVDALNGIRSTVDKYASYDATNKKAGVLLSSTDATSLPSSLAAATGQLLTGSIKTLSALGVSLNRDGTYDFDDSKLRTALGADPAGVNTALSTVAKSVATWARNSDGVTGTAFQAQQAAKAQSKDYGQRIDDYQVILTAREDEYRRQFAQLETLLGQLKDQSNWLAGQIASLG